MGCSQGLDYTGSGPLFWAKWAGNSEPSLKQVFATQTLCFCLSLSPSPTLHGCSFPGSLCQYTTCECHPSHESAVMGLDPIRPLCPLTHTTCLGSLCSGKTQRPRMPPRVRRIWRVGVSPHLTARKNQTCFPMGLSEGKAKFKDRTSGPEDSTAGWMLALHVAKRGSIPGTPSQQK